MVQNSSDLITLVGADGTMLYASPAIERLLGYAPEERVGRSVFDLVHPDDADRARGLFAEGLRSPGVPLKAEVRQRHRDGSWRHVEVTGTNLLGEPSAGAVVLNSRDVTERKRAEEALKESERRFGQLFENSADALFVIHPESREIADCNAEACRSLGYAREELLSLRLEDFALELLPEEEKSRRGPDTPWRRALSGEPGTIIGFHENAHRRKDGTAFPVEVGVGSIDYAGRRMILASCRDTTERKEAEARLREAEERYRVLVDNMPPVAYVEQLGEGRPVYMSPRVEDLVGHPPERFTNDPRFWWDLVHPEDRERVLAENARSDETGEPFRAEYRLIARDGRVVWVRDEAVLVSAGAGGGYWQGVMLDVTERKGFEEALKESEERLRKLADAAFEGIIIHDGGEVLEANEAYAAMHGREVSEIVGRPVSEWVAPEYRSLVRQHILSGHEEPYESVEVKKDGTRIDVEVRGKALPYLGRTVRVTAVRDITERKRAERALRESEKLFRQLFEQSSDALLVHDEAGMVVDCNSEACRSLGYSREELLSLSVEDFGIKLVSDEEGLDKDGMLWRRVTAAEPGTAAGAVLGIHRRKDGSTFPVEVGLSGVDYGGRRLILASCRDLTEREALESRLAHQAFHDALTGLPNRTLFSERLGQALARAGRGGQGLVAVLFLDLDNFKYVNDSLGHGAGDRLLVAVAERLRACLRPGDTAARLGGDEFTVLLEGVAGVGDATRVAERVMGALREPFGLGGRRLFVGASIGVALGEAGRDRPEDLLRKADTALYQAKGEGKARYALFDPEAERRTVRRLELENGLRRAVERDEFGVRYQPVVSLETGRPVGFEALVRWGHPTRGLVAPGEFVPLAEETGLIVPIGRRVLREACREARGWEELRPSGPPLTVGVNLSARQLSHPGVVGDVEEALDEAGLDPELLTLEVTEGVLVEDAERHAGALRELKDLGVRLAIDDFGTGYSSLSYLRRLPADLLKLDGSFVGGIGKGAGEEEVLLEGIIGIAHGLGLGVAAEGVETAEQASRLRGLGCDLAQGYHFSWPLPSEEAAAFLASDTRA